MADRATEKDVDLAHAILALHHVEYDSDREETWRINGRCAECQQAYPCPTAHIANSVIPPGSTSTQETRHD